MLVLSIYDISIYYFNKNRLVHVKKIIFYKIIECLLDSKHPYFCKIR